MLTQHCDVRRCPATADVAVRYGHVPYVTVPPVRQAVGQQAG